MGFTKLCLLDVMLHCFSSAGLIISISHRRKGETLTIPIKKIFEGRNHKRKRNQSTFRRSNALQPAPPANNNYQVLGLTELIRKLGVNMKDKSKTKSGETLSHVNQGIK